jgi:membrane associated rhomboid family serine protease
MFPLRDDQPTYSKPVVCTLLILINVIVFLHEMQLDDYSRNYFIMHYGLIPDRIRLTSLITMQFLHGGWMHIIGNMVFLWAFGRSLEDAMGSGKFLVFYLACGVAAALTQVLFTPGSTVPMVGASGAIAGVMGAYLLKFPRARIYSLVFIFIFITRMEIPALFFLPYWFLTQVLSGYGTFAYSHLSEGGTAYFAHIGGFVAGMILVQIFGTQNRYVRRGDIRW